MSDSDIFDIFNDPDIEDTPQTRPGTRPNREGPCDHGCTIKEGGIMVCGECGEEILKLVVHQKDWKYYSGRGTDPSRCSVRKSEDQSFFGDIQRFGFSVDVINMAEKIYDQVAGEKIFRGNIRKSVVFASVFNAMRIVGPTYSCDSLRELFNIDKKIVLKGLKLVNIHSTIRAVNYITPMDIIKEYILKINPVKKCLQCMSAPPKFNEPGKYWYTHCELCKKNEMVNLFEEESSEINKLFEKIKNKSQLLNRSRNQSLISSLIFHYISEKRGGVSTMNIKEFGKCVKLSDMAILKIVKEIKRILNTPENTFF